MAKGIIYVMSTVVDGLIKIGKTGMDGFAQRMNQLESNGYRNVSGLKRQFAIEVEDYDEKEVLLHNLFSRSQVANTELFSLNINEVIQLLSSFEGKVIYPIQETKKVIFENATESVESLAIPDGKYKLDVKLHDNTRCKAEMVVKNGKITVQKGAVLGRYNNTNITVESWRNVRECLLTSNGITLEDFAATSPSMAAAIILGHNANGWKTWKDANNRWIDIYREKPNTLAED